MTELIYDLLFLIPLELTTASFLHGLIEPEETKLAWIMISVLTSGYLLFMKHLKRRGRAYLLGGLLTLLLAIWVIMPSGSRIDLLLGNMWILKETALAIVIFIIAMTAIRYLRLRVTLALAGMISLIIMLVRGYEVNKTGVSMIFLFTLLTIADIIQRRSQKEGDTEPKKHLAATSVFMVVPFILILAVSVPDKPYDWHITRRIAGFIRSEFIMLGESLFTGNAWDDDKPFIGFSENANVGGDLKQSVRTVMEFESLSENDPKIYLTGKIFDHFDGSNWTKTDESSTDQTLLDTVETVAAALEISGKRPLGDYMKRSTVNLKYGDMYTACLFTALKTVSIKSADESVMISGGEHAFSKKRNSRKPYEITFYRLNRDSEIFTELAGSEHKLTQELLDEAKKKCDIKSDITLDDMSAYHKEIYDHYLERYEISDEALELLNGMIEGTENDYDKLTRLESFLGGMGYTDDTGPLPDDIDTPGRFLDYLLFDKKEGYCSYYASAFVILSRQMGIPSRYVQGFSVPVNKQKSISILSDRAHAWAECYIEGLGWIMFEPTPGMKCKVSWAVSQISGGEETADTAVNPGSPYDNAGETSDTPEEEEKPRFRLKWYQIAIPVGSGALFTLILVALDIFLRKRRYDKMSEKEKSEFMCRNCLELLRKKHLGRYEEETLAEYGRRIKDDIPEELLQFIMRFERILYSDDQVDREDRLMLEENHTNLKRYLSNRRKIQNE